MLKFKTKPKVSDDQIEQLAIAAKEVDVSPWAELVDHVGALQEEAAPIIAQIAELQEKLKPLAEKKAELQKIMDELPGDDAPQRLNGTIFRADAGKKGSSRSIKDMALVKKFMGAETFMKVATVKLGDIDKYLTGDQREQVTETSRTSRTVKVTRLPE
jgi:hypothetical protein